MNTLFRYLYRDASNYKQYRNLVVEGSLTPAQMDAIREKLQDGEDFIPEQVGLEALQEYFDYLDEDDDHPWHEVECIEPTASRPNDPMSAQELFDAFMAVEQWQDIEAAQKLFEEAAIEVRRGSRFDSDDEGPAPI